MPGFFIVLVGLGGITLFIGYQLYQAGRRREKLEQAERDQRTEDLIRDKRDELSTATDDDLDKRLRRWQ